VIWGSRPGEIRELAPLPGDSVGVALGINDQGQAVGGSGRCGNTILPPLASAPHAVLWEKDGSVHYLGSLGGTNINMALFINNHGQVVGASAPPGGTSPFDAHTFLWTREMGMRDLGTLPGDVASVGAAINDDGEVVGGSFDAEGNSRAFVWQNGVMHSLDDPLIAPDSPLFLLIATAINARGEIFGFGATSAGEVHAFLATPRSSDHR
jgi:probable HAF family extracellular repeat protein